MLHLRRAIAATVIFLTVLILILGCSSGNQRHSKNTEVVVTYDVEDGGLWKSEKYLRSQALLPTKKYLVFGAEWCGACRALVQLLDDAKVLNNEEIIFLNVDDLWVIKFMSGLGEIRGVPYMIEVKRTGEFGERRAGLGIILTYLIANVETTY